MTLASFWRSARAGAWLGWRSESNWTDPFLFALYSLVQPLARLLIPLFMYLVIARLAGGSGAGAGVAGSAGGTTTAGAAAAAGASAAGGAGVRFFDFLYTGNALFLYVGAVLSGMSWVIIEDREFYQMIRYIWIAAPSFPGYLVGRSAAKLAIATVSVSMALLVGWLWLDVPLTIPCSWFPGAQGASLPALLFFFVLGLAASATMGLGMAGANLLSAREGGDRSEALNATLYLFCGAAFPLDVLPGWARPLGLLLPQTYWLEGMRRLLLPPGASFGKTLSGLDLQALLERMAVTGAIWAVIGVGLLWLGLRAARGRGSLDQVTEH